MTVREVDLVKNSSPRRFQDVGPTRIVQDLGGAESLAVQDFQEQAKGRRVMIFRRRKGRKPGSTFIRHLGHWYKVEGVQPVRGNRTRDTVFLFPERPDGEIAEDVTIGGEPVTIQGEKVTV